MSVKRTSRGSAIATKGASSTSASLPSPSYRAPASKHSNAGLAGPRCIALKQAEQLAGLSLLGHLAREQPNEVAQVAWQ